jgi:DNA-binding GntR family transcriptional regulator
VGYTTSALTSTELAELRRARRALETVALEVLAGSSGRVPPRPTPAAPAAPATPAVPTPRPGTARDWLAEERRFHDCLMTATGMPRMAETYRRLWNIAERRAALMCPTAAFADRLRRDHQDLQLALRAGDLERAQAVLAAHYERMDAAAEPHRDDPRFFVTRPQAAG